MQSLPFEQQQRLPQDSIQAFRLVLDDPDVVSPWYRYNMIQGADRVAKLWHEHLPTEIQAKLPKDPLEALQSIVGRRTANQRLPTRPAPSTTTINTQSQGPTIARRVLMEQEQQLPQGMQGGPPRYGLPPVSSSVPPAPQEVVQDVHGSKEQHLNEAQPFNQSRNQEMEHDA